MNQLNSILLEGAVQEAQQIDSTGEFYLSNERGTENCLFPVRYSIEKTPEVKDGASVRVIGCLCRQGTFIYIQAEYVEALRL